MVPVLLIPHQSPAGATALKVCPATQAARELYSYSNLDANLPSALGDSHHHARNLCQSSCVVTRCGASQSRSFRICCRLRFDYSECLVGPSNTQVLEHAIAELAKRYQMEWRMFYDSKVKRVAILVSKLDHCLYDLLIRLKAGELNCQVPVIISNHPDLAPIAQQFGVAFRYHHPCPLTRSAVPTCHQPHLKQAHKQLTWLK